MQTPVHVFLKSTNNEVLKNSYEGLISKVDKDFLYMWVLPGNPEIKIAQYVGIPIGNVAMIVYLGRQSNKVDEMVKTIGELINEHAQE